MKYLNLLFLYILLTFSFSSSAQKCSYTIDTAKILSNKNLDKFISDLQTQKFITINDKKGIPVFIKKQLDCLTKKFSIANPDQEYACCCTSSQKLPSRKLIYLAISGNTLVMSYLTGGFAESTHLLLIQFDNDKILDLWTGHCSENIKSNQGIAKYLTENKNKEWGLNTNLIYL
jgi:hypothetical protein